MAATNGNNNLTKPNFWVRDIPVYGDTILAPMAQYSDVPYRALCRAHGSAMSYTEFVPATALLHPRNPMWRRLDIKPGGEKLKLKKYCPRLRKHTIHNEKKK